MSGLSPIRREAFTLLCDDICEHLDQAEALAFQDNDWSAEDITNARELLNGLVLGIRELMIEHELQSGECETCASLWPCSVMTTIHRFVKDPEGQFVALANRRVPYSAGSAGLSDAQNPAEPAEYERQT